MKRIICIIVSVLLGCALLLAGTLIYVDKTEWTLRPEEYNVSIPITTACGTIFEIENQVKVEVLKKCPNAYLGEIDWETSSNDGFETLADGKISFIYCENLGTWNGYYSYDRYVFCEVTVDLTAKEITQIEIYGNNQLGGRNEIETYPEFEEIRESLRGNWKLANFYKEYNVTWCYINVYATHVWAKFTVRLVDGTEKRLEGRITNGEFIIDKEI